MKFTSVGAALALVLSVASAEAVGPEAPTPPPGPPRAQVDRTGTAVLIRNSGQPGNPSATGLARSGGRATSVNRSIVHKAPAPRR